MGPFSAPEFGGPVDLEGQLEGIPAAAQTKGWLFVAIVDHVRQRGFELDVPQYADFKDYPTRDHVGLLVRAAELLAPDTPRAGLEQLGAATFPVFASSLLGRIILEGVGRADDAALTALRMAPRIYAWMTAGRAQLELIERGDRAAVLRMRRVWAFPESYQVGLLTAAGRHLGLAVQLQVASVGLDSADLLFQW